MPLIDSVIRHFRTKRMQRFAREFGVTNDTRILDVGGTPLNWSFVASRPLVTIVNLPGEPLDRRFAWVWGDGCALPFADASFDIVFSNSVIEHVGDTESHRRFAEEIARVGRAYWVETPNRWFPIEPHMMTPLLHLLPAKWQRRIVHRFTVWSMIERPSRDRRDHYVEHYLRDIRLLDAGELRRLFPGAEIVRERLGGWTKSLIAVRRCRINLRDSSPGVLS